MQEIDRSRMECACDFPLLSVTCLASVRRNENLGKDIIDVKDALAWHELIHNKAEDIRDAVDILESYAR